MVTVVSSCLASYAEQWQHSVWRSTPNKCSPTTISFYCHTRPIHQWRSRHRPRLPQLPSTPLLAHEDLRSPRLTSPIRCHPYARHQTNSLSSPSRSENEGEDEVSPQQSSATPTPASEQQARRIRTSRPKAAGRHSLRDLLRWEVGYGQGRRSAAHKRNRMDFKSTLNKAESSRIKFRIKLNWSKNRSASFFHTHLYS
jgi:hypothetical protein